MSEALEAKFVLINGITLDKYIEKEVKKVLKDKMQQFAYEIQNVFNNHKHNIEIIKNFDGNMTLRIDNANYHINTDYIFRDDTI